MEGTRSTLFYALGTRTTPRCATAPNPGPSACFSMDILSFVREHHAFYHAFMVIMLAELLLEVHLLRAERANMKQGAHDKASALRCRRLVYRVTSRGDALSESEFEAQFERAVQRGMARARISGKAGWLAKATSEGTEDPNSWRNRGQRLFTEFEVELVLPAPVRNPKSRKWLRFPQRGWIFSETNLSGPLLSCGRSCQILRTTHISQVNSWSAPERPQTPRRAYSHNWVAYVRCFLLPNCLRSHQPQPAHALQCLLRFHSRKSLNSCEQSLQ